MANLFLNLPLPVGNGPGASVDTSAMGGPRTITALGSFPGSTLTIEISNDGGATFAPLTLFQNVGGDRVIPIAAEWMRVNVSGRKSAVPFAANVDVGAPATGGLFAVLPLPVGNGAGAPVNIAAFGPFITAIVTGSFGGCSIIVEISEDGIDWAPSVLFASYGGHASRVATANFARARVSGRSGAVPFTGVVALGAIDLGGSIGGQLVIEDEGVPVAGAPHNVINFTGAGVTATDAGGGVVDVNIPGGGGGSTTTLIWGCDGIGAAADTRYLPPGHDFAVAPVTDTMGIPVVRDGTLRLLGVRHNGPGGNGQVVDYELLVIGLPTGIIVSVGTGGPVQAVNLVNTVPVVAGEYISLRATKTNAIGGGMLDVQAIAYIDHP